jgi:ABC-type branched-subunit amino acid transport system substrate-binding protein
VSLLGLEAVRFNRAFAAAGLDRHCIRLALAQDETVLYASGAENTENLMVASHYLADVRTRGNDCFLELYHTAFGPDAPPANAFGQSCYEGLHALADLARHAGRIDPIALRRAAGESVRCRTARRDAFDAPLGAPHPVYVAAVDGFAQNVVKSF